MEIQTSCFVALLQQNIINFHRLTAAAVPYTTTVYCCWMCINIVSLASCLLPPEACRVLTFSDDDSRASNYFQLRFLFFPFLSSYKLYIDVQKP